MIRVGANVAKLCAFWAVASVACVGLKNGGTPAPDSDSGSAASRSEAGSGGDARASGPADDSGSGGDAVASGPADASGSEGDGGDSSPADASGGDAIGIDDHSSNPAPSDASDAGFDAGDSASVIEADAAVPLPVATAPGHLRLWLTAQAGVQCSGGRVTTWQDQSPNHDDAALMKGQLGPQCQIPNNPHSVRGIDLPYFSAPAYDAGGTILDETLDVDLSFLKGSDYTFFTVERRWADGLANDFEYIFGTTMPLAIEEMDLTVCGPNTTDNALSFGYVYYYSTPSIAFNTDCNPLYAAVNPLPDGGPPAPLSEHAGEFAAAQGHQVWENGTSLASDLNANPLVAASDGAIGRAHVQTTIHQVDPRFRGDIAEVVVYDTSLTDGDRAAIDQYLMDRWAIGGM